MTFFNPPKSINTSFQERAKFNFVWRITLVFTLVVFIITTIGFFANDKFFFYYLAVLLMTTTSLYFIARFRTYKSVRSEEHTSELESRPHLVCRLLLEKK